MNNSIELKQKKEKQELIIKQIIAIAKSLNYTFTLQNDPIEPERAFASTGLLPSLMRRADQLCSFCMGYGLGVTFERADNSILGVAVNFDDKVPISLRLLCITDILLEIVHTSSSNKIVSLDSLMED